MSIQRQIEELAAAEKAAPEGEWRDESRGDRYGMIVWNQSGGKQVCGFSGDLPRSMAAFVVEAKRTVPSLITELARRQRQIEKLQRAVSDLEADLSRATGAPVKVVPKGKRS